MTTSSWRTGALPGVRMLAMYGVTEACVYQTAGEIAPGGAGHVGTAMGGGGYVIVRDGAAHEAASYLVDASATAAAFPRCAAMGATYYRTGNRGRVDPRGRLVVCGRIAGGGRQVKIHGI